MAREQPHITFNHYKRVVTYLGRETDLSGMESDLLVALIQFQQSGGDYVPKARLLRRIYGPDADTATKAVDVMLCRLKRRMAKGGIPFVVYTVWSVGIRLMTPIELNPPVDGPREFVLPAHALPPLRELLKRCSDRPADAELSERVRSHMRVVFAGGPN